MNCGDESYNLMSSCTLLGGVAITNCVKVALERRTRTLQSLQIIHLVVRVATI